jgi:hypothetical protein
MPKSPHDLLAFFVLFASLAAGVVLTTLAKRRFTEQQLARLTGRPADVAVMVVLALCVLAGFWYAPVRSFWPIVLPAVGAGFAAFRLNRLHAGQGYAPEARALLVAGLAVQLGGPVAAVLLRAAP